jgi:flagellar basal-body rod modification protein FlgD
MIGGVKGHDVAATQVLSTPLTGGGATAEGNVLSDQKDAKEAQTAAKFGDLWKQIQTKYGAGPEKPREIKKTLGKDDFLRIMITQMKYQDPTQPMKAEQFSGQLAQFTSVEQLQNLNQSMNRMATQNQPLERLSMTGLIGKNVTVDRERFPHTEGVNDTLNFTLPKDAASVRVAIIAENGDAVLEKDLGSLKQGENTFGWDGIKTNTLPAKNGTYMFRVEAVDEKGQSITINTRTKAKIVGVSFEGTEPTFLVGDINKPDKVNFRNLVRIEDGAAQEHVPSAIPMSSAPTISAPTSVFQALANAPAAQQQQQAQTRQSVQLAPQAQQPYSDSEKGFPNGLQDY